MTDDYRTIPSLMLKDTEYAIYCHGHTIYSIQEALQMCDALEEMVKVWKEGMRLSI